MKLKLLSYFGLIASIANAQTITTTDVNGNTIVEVITVDPVLGVATTQIVQTLAPANGAATSSLTTSAALASTSTQVLQVPTPPTSSTTTQPVPPAVPAVPAPVVPTTAPDVQQGPVGQPAPTPTGPVVTVYHYTTVDAAGDTEVFTATFIPTFPATQLPPPPTTTGSILQFSQWQSLVGTNTVPASSGGVVTWTVPRSALEAVVGIVSGTLAGAWLVFA